MTLCSKFKIGLCEIVTKSQVVTKFNVTKSILHCLSKIDSILKLKITPFNKDVAFGKLKFQNQ